MERELLLLLPENSDCCAGTEPEDRSDGTGWPSSGANPVLLQVVEVVAGRGAPDS